MNRYFLICFRIFIITTFLKGCNPKNVPNENLTFDKSFLQLFQAVNKKDTLLFENNKNGIDTFILTKTDSILNNKKGIFINSRNFKEIYTRYKQVPINYWAKSWIEMGKNNSERKKITEDARLITITKFLDNNKCEMEMWFKNFNCTLKDSLGILHKDNLQIGRHYITNYYILKTQMYSSIDDKGDVDIIYVTLNDGIVAYREKSDTIRARIN